MHDLIWGIEFGGFEDCGSHLDVSSRRPMAAVSIVQSPLGPGPSSGRYMHNPTLSVVPPNVRASILRPATALLQNQKALALRYGTSLNRFEG